MRWVTGVPAGGGAARTGILIGDSVHWAAAEVTLLGLLRGSDPLGDRGRALLEAPDLVNPLGDCTLLAPLPDPPSIRDFASFEQHIQITYAAIGRPIGERWKEAPSAFFLNPATVCGPDAPVAIPPGCAALDFELEIALVIGKTGRDLRADEALAHVAGFLLLNDWSGRDVQRAESARGLNASKAKDGATSIGPWLVTTDEFDGADGAIEAVARVNGREYGRGRLGDMYWSFAELVAYASIGCTLQPGEIIASGTFPGGSILELSATHGSAAFPWLTAGDVVEVEAAGLGTLRTPIVAAPVADAAAWREPDRRRPVWTPDPALPTERTS